MGTKIDSVGMARTAIDAMARYDRRSAQWKSALDALVDPAAALVIEQASAAMLRVAGEEALGARRWAAADIARLVKRDEALDKYSRDVIRKTVSSCATGDVLTIRWPADERTQRSTVVAIARALRFLRALPVLPQLDAPAPPPAAVDDPEQARMLEKVRALLAKAESTTFEEEADVFTAKAQELMARYAIDEALLEASNGGQAGGGATTSAVGGIRIGIDDPYARPKSVLLSAIASENRCRAVWSEHLGLSTVFGTHNDLRAVELLYTSLLVQATAAMRRADAVERHGSSVRSFRYSFLVAFAYRIGERLREANDAVAAAVRAESGDAFLPVLASRVEAVEQARDAVFPRLSSSRLSVSNGAGFDAGLAAADAAVIQRGAPLPDR